VFRGLRARVGIAYGTPTMRKPLNSGRADYFGPLPNLAARVMASAAYGQTLVEPTLQLRGVAWDSTAPVLRSWDESDPDDVLLTVLGRFSLKGVPHEVTLAQVGAHARASHACTHACTHARTHTRARAHAHLDTRPHEHTRADTHRRSCAHMKAPYTACYAYAPSRTRAIRAPRSRHARAMHVPAGDATVAASADVFCSSWAHIGRAHGAADVGVRPAGRCRARTDR
jgi:hypothetical protein